ncbi:MAG: UDP-N-acetylglucosamine 2-epimerase (non-hydrolyzing) [Chitinivibrionales bacterium]|nr:UDP-N-acetylglucosamine 2-epimerase (non-hydrolyzing) [Chitinivibrionales bacterium]
MKKILFIFGTRPELIKFSPLVQELKKQSSSFAIELCNTGQHRELVDHLIAFFGLDIAYNLRLMQPNQSLTDFTALCQKNLNQVIEKSRPDLIFIQGDTSTALSAAFAGFYNKRLIAHLEAGLRSDDKYSPFPEEMNRTIISHMADFHFAPTYKAIDNLRREGITHNVWMVGNTVIDALLLTLDIITATGEKHYFESFKQVDFSRRIILVTCHRRENFGPGLENICQALKKIAEQFPECLLLYPVHPNPEVCIPVRTMISSIPNIILTPPLDYPHLIWLMKKSFFIITDSGGIQEEAPTLGKPVLVTRAVTERMEAVEVGSAKIVGTNQDTIVHHASQLLNDPAYYASMAQINNPFGDGKTSKQIVQLLQTLTWQ